MRKRKFELYCADPENIENYEKAKVDDFKGWNCHHRLETHNSDGEKRLVNITPEELKALDMYYNRPSSELIFLITKEHLSLHHKGRPKSEKSKKKMSESWSYDKHFTEESRKKMSKAQSGKNNGFYGKKHSDETKKKISLANKGSHHTEEEIKKISKAQSGKHWFNNGFKEVFRFECPDGFVPGRL